MKKNYGKALFSFVIAGMMTLSMFSAGTNTVVNAEEPIVYTTTAADTGTTIENVIDGTTKNAAGKVYDGIVFAVTNSSPYIIEANTTISRQFSIVTNDGVTATLSNGFYLKSGANLSFSGKGTFIVDGENKGDVYLLHTNYDNVQVTMNHANVIVRNSYQYGIYM